jgi:hypothetical protein
VALLYTQLAAIIDHSYDGTGQIKNKAIALCRVPLRAVAAVLPDPAKQFLSEQAWVELLRENNVNNLTRFISDRIASAKEYVAGKQDAADQARRELPAVSGQLANTDVGDQHDELAETVQRLTDVIADYDGALAGLREWQSMAPTPKRIKTLNAGRQAGQFPWSILDQAFVPALEGRALAPPLRGKGCEALFAAGSPLGSAAGPDGGPCRDLDTGTQCDMGSEALTVDEFVSSAFLAPGGRPISPERVFGGMAEVPVPDSYQVRQARIYLIPLELRVHGKLEVTWDELAQNIQGIVDLSQVLLA